MTHAQGCEGQLFMTTELLVQFARESAVQFAGNDQLIRRNQQSNMQEAMQAKGKKVRIERNQETEKSPSLTTGQYDLVK